MAAMKIFLSLALLFAPVASCAEDANSDPAISEQKAHPDLLRLEQDLTAKQAEKNEGRLPPERYHEWELEFRSSLESALARVPSSPDNTAAHARITALLGERDRAQSALDHALDSNPDSPVLLRTKSGILLEQNDYPGAARYALEAWEKSGKTDEAAWALYQVSKGRGTPSGTTSSPAKAPDTATTSTDNPNSSITFTERGRSQLSVIPGPGTEESAPAQHGKNLPLWPIAVPFAGGLIAYGIYRGTKGTGDDLAPEEQGTAFAAGTMMSPVRGPTQEVAKAVEIALRDGRAQALVKGARSAPRVLALFAAPAVITGATFGLIVGAGVATIYGLDRMIEAQDKYNESIATLIQPSTPTRESRAKAVRQPTPMNTEPEESDYSDPRRRREYLRAKDFCDSTPPLGDDECSNLSKLIDHAEKCIELYEKWDDRWQPGRHDPKIGTWKTRLQNLKFDHKKRCAQK